MFFLDSHWITPFVVSSVLYIYIYSICLMFFILYLWFPTRTRLPKGAFLFLWQGSDVLDDLVFGRRRRLLSDIRRSVPDRSVNTYRWLWVKKELRDHRCWSICDYLRSYQWAFWGIYPFLTHSHSQIDTFMTLFQRYILWKSRRQL